MAVYHVYPRNMTEPNAKQSSAIFREVITYDDSYESFVFVQGIAILDHWAYHKPNVSKSKELNKLKKLGIDFSQINKSNIESLFAYMNEEKDQQLFKGFYGLFNYILKDEEKLKELEGLFNGLSKNDAKMRCLLQCSFKSTDGEGKDTIYPYKTDKIDSSVHIKKIKSRTYYIFPYGESEKLMSKNINNNEALIIENYLNFIDDKISYYKEALNRSEKPVQKSILFCMKCGISTYDYKILKCEHIICTKCIITKIKSEKSFLCGIADCKQIIDEKILDEIRKI